MANHSWLIALEGVDGAGTSTQVPRLAAHLRERGWAVLTCAQPSGGPLGVVLRGHLRGGLALPPAALALAFAADRLMQLDALILPFLAQPGARIAICDRYVLSSLAYQGAWLPLDWVAQVNAYARPADLTCFLRVGQATAAGRRQERGGAAEAFDGAATQARVAAAYERALASEPKGATVVVDGEADRDQVFAQLTDAIDRRLEGGRGATPP